MKMQVYTIRVLSVLTVISATLLLANYFPNMRDIFYGVFSGGIPALAISIAVYRVERIRALEATGNMIIHIAKNIDKIEYCNKTSPDKHYLFAMDEYLSLYDKNIKYMLECLFDIRFFFNHKKTFTELHTAIYIPLWKLNGELLIAETFFREYRRAENGNLMMVKDKVRELQSILFEVSENEVNGTIFESSQPKLTPELRGQADRVFRMARKKMENVH